VKGIGADGTEKKDMRSHLEKEIVRGNKRKWKKGERGMK